MPQFLLCLFLLVAAACQRGGESNKPPVHPVQDMDHQPKYKTQAASAFFADHAAMRMPVPGTVAAGPLHEDAAFYQGMDSEGQAVTHSPLPTTPELLARGRERFAIFCKHCHSLQGDGQGTVIARGFIPPPVFWEERLKQEGDGYIFAVISNGVRTMPSHAHQIPAADRWAIVAHVRTLQQH